MMSSHVSPIIFSTINSTPNALCLSASPTTDVFMVYASGLFIHILDASSLSLQQSINLIDHLPHLESSSHSINALHFSHQNLKLAASCGHLTVVFERSHSTSYPWWNLHSTFGSYISKISLVQLKDSYCLVAGKDGISLHQILEDTFNPDNPPRWIKRWTLRGQSCDQADFEMLEDGTCLVVASQVGSPLVVLYELHPSRPSDDCEFSSRPLCFSLPIHSIHLSHETLPLDALRCPVSLMVQVVNPVLGIVVHFYRLNNQPFPVPLENHNQIHLVSRSTPKVRPVHKCTCAISLPPNSPQILTAFPLDNLNQGFVSQNPPLMKPGAELLLVALSNGQVNLAQSSKNTSLLSPTPYILPEKFLDLLKTTDTMIQIAFTLHNHSPNPEETTCSLILRPLTTTGEIFVIEIPLMGLLVPPVVSNLDSRLLSIKTIPFGFTPMFTPISFHFHGPAPSAGLLVTASRRDQSTKYVCLVGGDIPSKAPLLAYAAVTTTEESSEEVEAVGFFQDKSGHFHGHSGNSTATVVRSTTSAPSRVGFIGVFISHLNHKIHTRVHPLCLKRFSLAGLLKSERSKTLIANIWDPRKSSAPKGKNSILCLTSSSRLILWNVPDDLDPFDRESSITLSREIPLPGTLLSSTLTLIGSSSPLIIALDTDDQLFRSKLPDNYNDPKVESLGFTKISGHPIGAKDSLNLNNHRHKAIFLEAQGSRFIAMLWLSQDTNRSQMYRIVILDLQQQPHSAGIVCLDDFEILKDDQNRASNTPLLKWSDYQKSSHILNYCFLAVCCADSAVRVYTRGNDGWWKQTWGLHSKFGSISQMSWISHSDYSILLYQTAGHTLASSPISNQSRLDLPPWHPIVLKNRLLFGNIPLVIAIVASLSLALRGVTQPLTLLSQMLLSSYLVEEDTVNVGELNECASELMVPHGMSPTILSSVHIEVITGAVNMRQIPLLSEKEQFMLLDLSKTLLQVQAARSHGIDLYGCRYIFALSNYLRKSYSGLVSDTDFGFGVSQDCGILLAHLSTSQSLLAHEVCNVLQSERGHANGSDFKLDWNTAKSVGLFLWLQDQNQIKTFIERVGQVEYTKGGNNDNSTIMNNSRMNTVQEQDPAACSLFFLALSKKRLLLGLWKVAYGHSDRDSMMKFLQNDFSEDRWKAAAQKNAFALISRQRFRFAASFFLLADRLQDAVNVCVQRLSDWQLGVAICRAYEGDGGPVLKKLVKEIVLPIGFANANRWLISWCFNMLSMLDLACKVLAAPWEELVTLQAGTFPVECRAVRMGPLDLSLVLLFNQLKVKYPSSMKRWEDEKKMVMLGVDELMNSGCNGLASILLKNWNLNGTTKGFHSNPKQIGFCFDQPDAQSNQICHHQEDIDSSEVASRIKNKQDHNRLDTAPSSSHQDDKQVHPIKNRVLSQPVVPEFDMSQFI